MVPFLGFLLSRIELNLPEYSLPLRPTTQVKLYLSYKHFVLFSPFLMGKAFFQLLMKAYFEHESGRRKILSPEGSQGRKLTRRILEDAFC